MNISRYVGGIVVVGALVAVDMGLPVLFGSRFIREAYKFDNIPVASSVYPEFKEDCEQNKRFFNYCAYGCFGASAFFAAAGAYMAQDEIRNKTILRRTRNLERRRIQRNKIHSLEMESLA